MHMIPDPRIGVTTVDSPRIETFLYDNTTVRRFAVATAVPD